MSQQKPSEFEQLADRSRGGIVHEFLGYLGHHKKWWLTPVLLMLAVLGVLVILGGTGAAPFIYTLF